MKFKKRTFEKGMTLVELLVAISILGIVTIGMSYLFVYMWKSKAQTMNMGQSAFIVSQAVAKISENIRKSSQADSGAYLLSSGDDFDLIVYASIDQDENMERVHYYLDGNSIMMGSAEPILGTNPTYPTDDELVKEVVGNVVNGTTEPIFTYYDESGAEVVTPIVDTSSVRMIKISVVVNSDPSKIRDVLMETSVAFRNIY